MAGSPVRLILHRDEGIYQQEVSVKRITSTGNIQSTNTIPRHSHLAYNGQVYTESPSILWRHSGTARLMLDSQEPVHLLLGAFIIDDDQFNIQSDASYRATWTAGEPEAPKQDEPYMVAWKAVDSDINAKRQEESQCLSDSLDFNNNSLSYLSSRLNSGFQLEARQNSIDITSVIGDTSGCPKTRQIALLGIATDCTYTAQFSSDDDIRRHVVSQINAASEVYERSFNISLRVRDLIISDSGCPTGDSATPNWNRPCSSGLTINDRLGRFTEWRNDQGDTDDAVWSLLTTCNSGSTVGIAWIGTACRQPSQRRRGVVGTNVVVRTSAEWQVLAHEIGHNFGASHDCTEGCASSSYGECCPLSRSTCNANGQFIMNPSANRRMTSFSPCTIGTICTSLGRNIVQSDCLSGNEDVPTITESECGNGIVEPGEECDCGGEEGCRDNNCCDANTCRFVNGATCDPSAGACCTDQCQLASSGSVCRRSTGLCDPEETCDGSSVSCPSDEKLPDGETCGDDGDGLTCASGQCTSRQLQCSNAFNISSSNIQACDDTSCQLSCIISGQENGSCQEMNQDLLDGTPCGSGSRCQNGSCVAIPASGVRGWIDRNRTLFIVICVVGGIFLLSLMVCLCCCLRRKHRVNKARQKQAVRMGGNPQMSQAVPPVYPPPPPPPARIVSNLPRYG